MMTSSAVRRHETSIINAWNRTLEHLASCDIEVVCYNFMPVLDWTRTDLNYELPTGAMTLRFDHRQIAVFDLHILERENARQDYTQKERQQAAADYERMTESDRRLLTRNIIAGLPGRMTDSYDLAGFRKALGAYRQITAEQLCDNLNYFLSKVVPVAERVGIRLAIHPDDPPWDLFGLPRVVGNATDITRLLNSFPSEANGIALCAGTYGACVNNNVPLMAKEFSDRIYFAHLRSVQHDSGDPKSFFEDGHLDGDIDLVPVVKHLLSQEKRWREEGIGDREIYVRPDHGHQILDDLEKTTNPGYSAIGRLKGLAEIRGVIRGLQAAIAPTY